MNVNDSLWLARALRQRDFEEAPLGQATATILNTCSVREKPELKVYSALGRISHATRHLPGAFVVVAGCVGQQIGQDFFDRFPQVRLVTGSDGLAATPDAIERLYSEPSLKICLADFSESYPERPLALDETSVGAVPPSAHVNIMQGCDNFCAYCIVPYTRGRQKSRSAAAVLDECRALLERGAREITLLGQNVNAYGQDDAGEGATFAQLLRQAAALPGLERLRFITPHPKDFSAEVVAAFADLGKLCPRLHLPLQAGSDKILAAMGRRYDRSRYLELTRALRAARPDMAFSSDIIVGFPGETEEDFQDTCSMLEEVGFMSSFSFCYSDRPGTRAAQLEDKIPKEVKLERLSRLQALQDSLGQAWLRARQGQDTVVLLESLSRKGESAGQDECWQGRDPYGAAVNVALPRDAGAPGRMVPVRISAAKRHTLLATQTGAPW